MQTTGERIAGLPTYISDSTAHRCDEQGLQHGQDGSTEGKAVGLRGDETGGRSGLVGCSPQSRSLGGAQAQILALVLPLGMPSHHSPDQHPGFHLLCERQRLLVLAAFLTQLLCITVGWTIDAET